MAQGGKAGKKWFDIFPLVQQFFPESSFLKTSCEGEALTFARECMANEKVKKIISVGGDGTNNEIINGLFQDKKILRKDISFGILPMGTGSDFSRTLKMPQEISKALKILKNEKKIMCDIGYVKFLNKNSDERYFLNVFSFGISGYSAQLIHQKELKKNRLTYFTQALKSLFQYEAKNTRLSSNSDVLFEGTSFLVALANGRYFGSGMKLSPNADIQSGLLDIVLVKGQNRPSLIKKFISLYSGSHIDGKKVQLFRKKEVKATSSEVIFSEYDGEAAPQIPFEAFCLKRVLPLIVPEDFKDSQ